MQNRFRSWALWVSVAALVGFVFKTYFHYDIPEYDMLINMALSVAVGFGIINNPTDRENF